MPPADVPQLIPPKLWQTGPPLICMHGSAPLALRMRGAGDAGLARLRATRGADLGAWLWLALAHLQAHRRAHLWQVRYGIGGQVTT